MDNLKPITSSRDCPVCAQPVPWTRYWLKPWMWATWDCPRCHTKLTFDRKQRMTVGIFAGAVMGSWLLVAHLFGWISALILVAAAETMFLHDRVTVAGNRNPNYCVYCRYDLTGTLGAAGNKCPECGQEIGR